LTKLAKTRAALRVHLEGTHLSADEAEDFLDEVAKSIQTSWEVDLGY
jgi:hypothetical protein